MSGVSAVAQEAAVGDNSSVLLQRAKHRRKKLRAKQKKVKKQGKTFFEWKRSSEREGEKRKKDKIKIYKQTNVFQVF